MGRYRVTGIKDTETRSLPGLVWLTTARISPFFFGGGGRTLEGVAKG